MLHSSTKVMWMDVKSQKVFTDTISNMFQMYSLKAQRTLDGISQVLFNPESEIVKITDMYGWTDVKSITRIDQPSVWVEINAADKYLYVSDDEILPIYLPESQFRGFHGEVKYSILPKSLPKLEEDDILRIHRGVSENEEDIEFAKIQYRCNIKDYTDSGHGYKITTKSGFFNGNNIHLLAESAIRHLDVYNKK